MQTEKDILWENFASREKKKTGVEKEIRNAAEGGGMAPK